jgi:hypothetical protein
VQRADDALGAALAQGERTTSHSTRFGGKDLGAQVQSWSVDRSYATDLPEAMRAFSGSASAQAEFEISGAAVSSDEHLQGKPDQSGPQLYSPWAPRTTGDLVRPGQSLVHAAGLGGNNLAAFRGTVRARSAASGSDTVKITALDGAERLRGPAVLPKPYIGFFRKRPVSSVTWCVDELLRQAGLHSSPPARYPEFVEGQPLTLVHATLHGGFTTPYGQPEVLPDPRNYTWTRQDAPHEMALVPTGLEAGTTGLTASWFPRSRVTVPGSRLFAEAWVNNAVGIGDTVELQLQLNRTGTATGTLRMVVDFAAGTVRIHSEGSDQGFWYFEWSWTAIRAQRGVWHIGAFFDAAGTGTTVYPTVQPRLTAPDGTQLLGPVATYVQPSGIQKSAELDQVRLVTTVAVESLQVTSGLSAMPTAADFSQSGTWTKGAVLDDAVFPLVSVPRVSGSQWDVLTQIAKATMATAEFDEHGVFRWCNHTRFAQPPTAADLTLTTVRDIAALTVTEEIDACRNYCVQPAKDWSKVGAATGTVYDDSTIREIPANRSVTVSYVMAEEEFDIGPPLTDDDSVTTTGSSVRFATSPAAGATAVKGAVDVLTRREDGYLVVRFSNRSAQTLYTVTKTGEPSVHLVTLKPADDPAERFATSWVAGSAGERFYGRQEYSAEATEWVQDLRGAQALADAMRKAGEYPVPVIGDVEVLHDPRIQLGDVVRLVDSRGAQLNTLAWVTGIKTAGTAAGGVQQTLTLRGTVANGVPADSGLTPDAPADPAPEVWQTYAQVAAAYPTLAEVKAGGRTWRDIKEGTHV